MGNEIHPLTLFRERRNMRQGVLSKLFGYKSSNSISAIEKRVIPLTGEHYRLLRENYVLTKEEISLLEKEVLGFSPAYGSFLSEGKILSLEDLSFAVKMANTFGKEVSLGVLMLLIDSAQKHREEVLSR